MKTYKLIYLDKGNNELKSERVTCASKKEAKKLAATKLANSMINDLKKITVQ